MTVIIQEVILEHILREAYLLSTIMPFQNIKSNMYAVNIVIFLLKIASAANISKQNWEAELIGDLLQNYNPQARPVLDPNKTVTLELSLKLQRLEEINTKFQYIEMQGYIEMWWTDESLIWNADDYKEVSKVALLPSNVWVPSVVLVNSAGKHLYDETWYKLFKINVSNRGLVYWSPGGIFKVQCSMDVWMFPFDDQICVFWFGNWIYTMDQVNLTHTKNAAKNMLKFYDNNNGQWEVLESAVKRSQKYYSFDNPYAEIFFGIHFKRKPLFYVTNIIILTVLLAALVILMFKLPIESGERISMGVTLLLSFSIFILMIDSMIPETSSTVPVITLYLVCFMTLTGLGICETVFVLSCFHHDGQNSPPKWLNKLLMKCNFLKCESGIELKGMRVVEINKYRWQQLAKFVDKYWFYLAIVSFGILMLTLLVIKPLTRDVKNLNSFLARL